MYSLTNEQIDFISDDIRARGVTLVSLQQDLLDHICCVVEHNLEPDGDFEGFYRSQIKTFYKSELVEIEKETITLLTLKNYYVMKKIMLVSGGISTAAMTVGLLLKFLHLPGASVLILLGVVLLSLVFLPLLFTLKIREKQRTRDKVIIGIGTFATIMISFAILFKMMHWPGANVIGALALMIMLLIFLPVYFFTGIRNPETKVNTIVSSVFILYGCAFVLMLVRSPAGSQKLYTRTASDILRSEQILNAQQKQARLLLSHSSPKPTAGQEIVALCETVKAFLVESETGRPQIDSQSLISENSARNYIHNSPSARKNLGALNQKIDAYNANLRAGQLSVDHLDLHDRNIGQAINDLIQTQIMVLQNETAIALVR